MKSIKVKCNKQLNGLYKIKNMQRVSFGLLTLLFISACGGSSSAPTDNNSQNNAPIVNITSKNSSVMEGMGIELNATVYDADNDTLSYKWVQLSGEKVTLVNEKTANPSFIAPEVSSDGNVSFQLEVDDGKVTTASTATVLVNIINVVKAKKRHEVQATSLTVIATNGLVKVDYTYNKIPISESTSGLVLNLYWDSSKLEYTEIVDILATDYMGVSAIKDDSNNKDTNVETDKYITVSWVNLEEGQWKVPTTLPTALFSVNMKSKDGESGTTTLNLKSNVDSPGLEFYAASIIVQL